MPSESTFTRQQFALLALLTVFWGMNWPVLKLGTHAMPPLWFRTVSLFGGTIIVGLYGLAMRTRFGVPARAWRTLAILSATNMVAWYLLGILAIASIPSGRAAIIGYTMPVWAALIGVIVYRERQSSLVWLGIFAALLATILLLAGEWESLTGRPFGVFLMLTAAIFWAAGTHLMRRMKVDMPTIAMTFWMMMIATVCLCLASAFFEFPGWVIPSGAQWWPILYNSVFVLGLCNVAWFSLARSLPPVASGLSGMLIPVVGVISSMLILGEVPHWRDYLALALILVSLATVLLPARARAQ